MDVLEWWSNLDEKTRNDIVASCQEILFNVAMGNPSKPTSSPESFEID